MGTEHERLLGSQYASTNRSEEENYGTQRGASRFVTPKDEFSAAYLSFILLGIGFLMPWNALLNSIDFFDGAIGDGWVFYGTVAYMSANFLGLIAVVAIGNRFSFFSRIVPGFVIFLILSILLPLIPIIIPDKALPASATNMTSDVLDFAQQLATTTNMTTSSSIGSIEAHNASMMKIRYVIVMVICAINGFADSIVQGSIYGLAGQFHPRFIGAVMAGNGWSGIIVSVIRIATLVAVPRQKAATSPLFAGGQLSAIIFFSLTGVILIACIVCFGVVLNRLPITKYYLSKGTSDRTKHLTSDMLQYGSGPSKPLGPLSVFGKTALQSVSVGINFWITLSLFPGIVSEIPPSTHSLCGSACCTPAPENDYCSEFSPVPFSVIIVALFNVGDFIGRNLPNWESLVIVPAKYVWLPVILRALFFGLFFLELIQTIHSDAIAFIAMFVFAVSNGYLGTLCMMRAPETVEVQDKEMAGSVSIFLLTFGLMSGVFTGTGLNKAADVLLAKGANVTSTTLTSLINSTVSG